MKILILSTFGNYGGAATCAKRLYNSLKKDGLDVELRAVQFYDNNLIKSVLPDTFLNRIISKFYFIIERLQVLYNIKKIKHLYKFSTGSVGLKLSNFPIVKEADIIHLHWINFGLVSIAEIAELANKKCLIWTQHDMWSFTGGCHYAMQCERYKNVCDDCFYLRNSALSESVQDSKISNWKPQAFKVIATSNWLAQCTQNSTVFRGWNVEVLPTPIDVSIFKPLNKQELRKKYTLEEEDFYILFGAVDIKDVRKGFPYLLDALEHLKEEIPNIHLITFGKSGSEIINGKVTEMGHIHSQKMLNEVYNLADLFILPSIQDNLPNTVMEASSCGVPVVAFDAGGIKDMIVHKATGYLAENYKPADLANGIKYFRESSIREEAAINARKHIVSNFSEKIISRKHIDLYEDTLKSYNLGSNTSKQI